MNELTISCVDALSMHDEQMNAPQHEEITPNPSVFSFVRLQIMHGASTNVETVFELLFTELNGNVINLLNILSGDELYQLMKHETFDLSIPPDSISAINIGRVDLNVSMFCTKKAYLM